MPSSMIDVEELLGRVENDREFLKELLSIFKEEFPQRLQALGKAVESRDTKGVVVEAHTLKGMLSNLAAGKAAEAAAELERLARNGETGRFAEALSTFKGVADELSRQVDACMAEGSA